MSVCVCTHVRGTNLEGLAPTLARVLAYMCACAQVNIYIYVTIYGRVRMHPCTWN